MKPMKQSRDFAYGQDKVDECHCPASRVGFSPSSGDESTGLAHEYDEFVKDLTGSSTYKGIISEETAKEAWLNTVDLMEERFGVDSEQHIVAKKIAQTLGWL